jgi:ABC-type Fe3+/spermidine/putrescine transport system ATPase subunit
MLEVKNIHKHYGDTAALRGLFLSVARGECLALLGPSGCGKTTLLRLIAGLETPDSGEIRIKGKVASTSGKRVPPYRRSVGVIFQDLALWSHMTVQQQIDFALAPVRGRTLGRYRRIEQILQQVRLDDLAHCYPHQLSGGEKLRLALGRALAQKPRILLLDEPLAGLDSQLKDTLLNECKQVVEAMHVAAIWVTRDRQEADVVADRIARMNRGRVDYIVPAKRPRTADDRSQTGSAGGSKVIWLNRRSAK